MRFSRKDNRTNWLSSSARKIRRGAWRQSVITSQSGLLLDNSLRRYNNLFLIELFFYGNSLKLLITRLISFALNAALGSLAEPFTDSERPSRGVSNENAREELLDKFKQWRRPRRKFSRRLEASHWTRGLHLINNSLLRITAMSCHRLNELIYFYFFFWFTGSQSEGCKT